MLIWRIVSGVALVVMFLFIGILAKKKYLRNQFTYPFKMERLIKKQSAKNKSISLLYVPSKDVREYIDEYALQIDKNKPSIICHYAKKMSSISFFISQFDDQIELLDITRVVERNPGTQTKLIHLRKNCKFVNIHVQQADGSIITPRVIQPVPKGRLRRYSFCWMVILMALLFVARQVVYELLGGEFLASYVIENSIYTIPMILVIAIAFYIILYCSLLKKNSYRKKSKKGA